MELLIHKTKHTEYTYYLKEGRKVSHGLYRERYEDGQLNYEWNFKDGKRHGLSKGWYVNGQLDYESYYWEGISLDYPEYEEQLVANRSW